MVRDLIIVCGCGPSAASLVPTRENYFVVGCNDCDKWFAPDHLVVGDKLRCFPPARQAVIRATRAQTVWLRDESIGHPDERMIRLRAVPPASRITPEMLDGPWLSFVMTPFMAISCAYRLGARRIGLLGVDLTRPSPLRFHVEVISTKLRELGEALALRGVELVNLSRESALRGLPQAAL